MCVVVGQNGILSVSLQRQMVKIVPLAKRIHLGMLHVFFVIFIANCY